MNISQCFDFLNFWINKVTGAFFTISELTQLVDRAQLAHYTDLKPKYATSQYVKDALSPFKRKWPFTPTGTISGYIVVQDDQYLDAIDLQIIYLISNLTVYYPVPIINEDERANRLNSQIDPVTITSPIAEQTAQRYFMMYPTVGYTGTINYFRRPIAPVFGYSIVSGRIIVYDPNTSTQLEWRDTEIDTILLKALRSIGINLTSADIAGWAQTQSQQNFSGVNKL